jgi:hypothetical protein
MDKRDIVRDMKNQFNGAALLNITQIAKYMGRSRNRIQPFLQDLEYLQMGTEKKYLIVDIAKKIANESRPTK